MSKPRHNSRTKLCIELSLIHNRDNVELYLHCKFQSSPFSVRRKNGVTDRLTDRMKHQRCRCLGGMQPFHTISHTQQQTAAVIPFCTAITMQCNQKPSVLTTNSTGRVYNVQFECRAQHMSETASIACLHNCCSKILTYQLLGSQLWIALPLKNSRSPATAMIERE